MVAPIRGLIVSYVNRLLSSGGLNAVAYLEGKNYIVVEDLVLRCGGIALKRDEFAVGHVSVIGVELLAGAVKLAQNLIVVTLLSHCRVI